MDGTLLDTERIYFDSLVAALTAHGYTDDTATLCQAMVGLPGRIARPCCTRAMARAFHLRRSAGLRRQPR
jgi:beta-phosphoglucomutase-like phosphatase (HAD superfamily)